MPDRASLRRALGLMKRRADYEYFFSRLATPDWIRPIEEEGLFNRPPATVRQGDYVQFPFWPELGYLARVAGDAPDLAAEVLLRIPATDNLRVHQDLTDVALKISGRNAAAWAEREAQWVTSHRWLGLLVPEKLAELTENVSIAGHQSEATHLTRALFDLQPDSKAEQVQEDGYQLPPKPRAKYDSWQYGKALQRVVSALTRAFDVRALRVFADLLERALELSASEQNGPPRDYSFIWRDAIEHGSIEDDDLTNALVSAVRDSAEIATKKLECATVVAELESRKWDVFRRLALHTIRVACPEQSDLTRERLISLAAFNDPTIYHEYAVLLKDRFGRLEGGDQAQVRKWIQAGPDRENMRDRHRRLSGQQLRPELEQAWVEQWQRDRLSPIRDGLPESWRATLDGLVQRYGPPEFDFVQHKATSVSWGAKSPVSVEHIQGLSTEELLRFLAEWVPEGKELLAPSREGVVQTLQGLGDAFFESQAQQAQRWRSLHPGYVATFLSSLARSVKAGRAIAWPAVLRLSIEVIEDEGNDWDTVWLKRTVADLLLAGFDAEPDARLPKEEGVLAWRLLEGLLRATDEESPKDRVSQDADNLTAAINSLAGKALEATIRYAVWAKREAAESSSTWSLDGSLPGVERILNEWVDPQSVRPADSRSIFGLQLGPLCWLDRKWVERHVAQLFPADVAHRPQRDVVWNTYLIYGTPFGQALDAFQSQYAQSVESLAESESTPGWQRHVRHRVAEHLMAFYWQGLLTHDGNDRLVNRFFEVADVKLRAHAMDFLGRSLRREDDLPPEPLRRLAELFEWRVSKISAIKDADERSREAQELSSFGWWFASAKFEPSWSLKMLVNVLRLAENVEPAHMVAGRLLEHLDKHGAEVAEALFLMVQTRRDYYTVAGWQEEARRILERLLAYNDAAVRQRAADTVDALLERRFHEFRDLSPGPSPGGQATSQPATN
mgnify:CR=1 FL=1